MQGLVGKNATRNRVCKIEGGSNVQECDGEVLLRENEVGVPDTHVDHVVATAPLPKGLDDSLIVAMNEDICILDIV